MNSSIFTQLFSAAAALLLTCVACRAGSEADDLIVKGNALDKTFHATEALEFYLPALKLEPKNVRLLVSIARQYRHLMTDATVREKKVSLGTVALGYSLRAAAVALWADSQAAEEAVILVAAGQDGVRGHGRDPRDGRGRGARPRRLGLRRR